MDECPTNVRMVALRALGRPKARAKGQRAFGRAPKNWKSNVTLISSMGLEGIGAPR